ncbi:hypothetical protein IMZ48_32095 [Candidatus Bathyarchaeota archaeon]|nr:hypothetical protein [Candidatus Bathyarchaeota archaeon]
MSEVASLASWVGSAVSLSMGHSGSMSDDEDERSLGDTARARQISVVLVGMWGRGGPGQPGRSLGM